LNRLFSSVEFTSSIETSETIAVLASILLFLQASVENRKEQGGGGGRDEEAYGDSASEEFITSNNVNLVYNTNAQGVADGIQWAFASLLAMTPATHVMLLYQEEDTSMVVYALGVSQWRKMEDQAAIEAAANTILQSKGGRVSLPLQHPAGKLISEEDNCRCMILQRVDDTKCIFVASNELLAKFTKNDLKWLGQLGSYIKSIS